MSFLWIGATLVAAAAQTARNAAQRRLIKTVGARGAAYARFLFGAPFAFLFLAAWCAATGALPPHPGLDGSLWLLLAGAAQIVATALMLSLMQTRSFFATISLTKTEPALVALFGFLALGERLSASEAAGVALATFGVALASAPTRRAFEPLGTRASTRSLVLGLGSAGLFALSSVAFRAALLDFSDGSAFLRAATALAMALALQSALILGALAAFERPALRALARDWRGGLAPGFIGAFASLFWFLAFALQSAALVRALGLVETPFARLVSRHMFGETLAPAETVGAALIVAGALILLLA